MFWIKFSYQIHVLHIFSTIPWLSFHFLDGVLWNTKVLNFNEVQFTYKKKKSGKQMPGRLILYPIRWWLQDSRYITKLDLVCWRIPLTWAHGLKDFSPCLAAEIAQEKCKATDNNYSRIGNMFD